MTREQEELLTMIIDKRETLNELLEVVASRKKSKQVKDLQMGESISIAGIMWSKFAEDDEKNAYMLADEKVCKMNFGKNNNWRESPIREELNERLYKEIKKELGENALIIQTDLFSHDGLRDYGKCEDRVSLLTYDLYRNNRENIKSFKQSFWTSTPNSTPSGCGSGRVRCVSSDGDVGCSWCDCSGAVRPFFILKSDAFIS